MATTVPRVIIDTDVGLDDAVAVLMVLEAHKQRHVNVVAITTTHGNTPLDNVNKNVLRLLHTVDMLHIPVYSGSRSPLIQPYLLPDSPVPYHGFDGFGDCGLPHPDPAEHLQQASAVDKIMEEVEKSTGELQILALGPLTNLALVKKLMPDFLCRLGALHLMGGSTTGQGNKTVCSEFNFVCDPEAAHIVLSREGAAQRPCPVYITPLEPCVNTVHLSYEFRQQLGDGPAPQASLMNKGEAAILAQRKLPHWTTYDQVAAAWMLDLHLGPAMMPDTERGQYSPLATAYMDCNVTVELQGTHTRGQMVLDKRREIAYAMPVRILTGINEAYYKRFLSMAFGKTF